MRVAYYSPLPPLRSGIADYSAELLPHLAAHCDIELVVDDGFCPEAALAARFPVHAASELGALLASGRCDVALYHLGNNPDFHGGIWKALLAHPGVLVLHEYVLHHLVRDITLHAGDATGYVDVLRWCYGRTGEALGRRVVGSGVPLDPFRYPLFERPVDASRAVIVHNRATADRVLASRPHARLTVVPHHLSLPGSTALAPAAARRALDIPPEALLISTFGFITPAKRLPVLLRAFSRLRAEVPAVRLQLVGEVSPHFAFDAIFTPELRAGVELVGRQGLDRFLLSMAACDVAVNLRHPTAGETSGTLVRLLGLGKPVVVSRTGAFAEIPDGCCAKVDLDDTEEELLFVTLRALARDPELRRAMGESARRHVAARTPQASAAAYAEVLRRCVEGQWQPAPAPPPLAPWPAEDLFVELVRDVGADLADLGVGERDLGIDAVGRALVALDLDRLGRGGARSLARATGRPR